MSETGVKTTIRVLPEDVANKIAAGEVVERPSSVVKELLENALDARATRIAVRVGEAGRRSIEVIDNGIGMSEQDAILAIERHATSKIRNAEDLDTISTMGFRGEALASIAAVSRFELVTRRPDDESATRVQIDGGLLRDVSQVGAPPGTRVSANRLYFNTPVRAKFLKGITTELSHCIDVVQRHALVNPGVGFQFVHNEKILLDIPEHATLRERVALIWGLSFVKDMIDVSGEQAGYKIAGLIGTPGLTRSSRSHQFFFLNRRPVVNRSLQYGFEEGYNELVTIGRHPVGVLLVEAHPRHVDVNIHPTKREVRFRDDRIARDAIRSIIRATLEKFSASGASGQRSSPEAAAPVEDHPENGKAQAFEEDEVETPAPPPNVTPFVRTEKETDRVAPGPPSPPSLPATPGTNPWVAEANAVRAAQSREEVQTEFDAMGGVAPSAHYAPFQRFGMEPIQLFDTYLLVPEDERLLIIDQHALHERLNYDNLLAELKDADYQAQQLAVPILFDVPPAHAQILEDNLELFARLGLEIEPFGDNTYQVTAICHSYDEGKVKDAIFSVLDELGQGNLFDRDDFMADFLRLATQACRASVKAGDRLSAEEKRELIEGFRRMRPPYTCPHGRPIITELTQIQMEKSFRRRQ